MLVEIINGGPLLSALENKIRNSLSQDFEQLGFADFESPIDLKFYKNWLDEGMHGNMGFLVDHIPHKEDPKKINSSLNSCIVFTMPYYPHPRPMELGFKSLDTGLKIGSYAQGEDYHYWFKQKLESAIDKLSSEFPDESFLAYTDSGPVLERNLAQKAGLGWVGKNTCIIHPKDGSLFFIGEILTSLKLKSSENQVPDRCGTCTRCIEACPTDALEERKLDARKCISYLSIEHKSKIEDELATKMGPWYFGCDICQQVCPWNEKKHGKLFNGNAIENGNKNAEILVLSSSEKENLVGDLSGILKSSNKAIAKRFRGSPLTRANGNMHKRNALMVASYHALSELEEEARLIIKNSQSEFLVETAKWYLNRLGLQS